MIPHFHILFEFLSILYENQLQTLNIKKIYRYQIKCGEYSDSIMLMQHIPPPNLFLQLPSPTPGCPPPHIFCIYKKCTHPHLGLYVYIEHKLWMMRGGTLLIEGHGFKGQGQIWHSVYKTLRARYTIQFLPNHFQTLHVSCS